MEKREIAKFLSGFFIAGALSHILVILMAGYLPNGLPDNIFNLRIWTISFIIFMALAIISAYIGWGIKSSKNIFLYQCFCW